MTTKKIIVYNNLDIGRVWLVEEERMLHIPSLKEGLDVFKALGSEIRVEIITLLLENNAMNMNDLANRLNIANSALTYHIKLLEECGLVQVSNEIEGHGNQKKCSVCTEKILIDIHARKQNKDVYQTSIKVGHYTDYQIYPSCGLANAKSLLGEVDDIRYFAHQSRYSADILWFSRGYVEYVIPTFIPEGQKITQISFSMELGSETPEYNNDWPSDISFILNDKKCATWTSPGDLGGVKALFTPEWWYDNWGQYGILKVLKINTEGTFIDGNRVSDITIDEFNLDYMSMIKLRLEVEENAEHVGGLTIFGKGFGNYNQDIEVSINYKPIKEE